MRLVLVLFTDQKNVIPQKGAKQVGRVTSGERGQNVTLAIAVNAAGMSIPPFFIFSTVNFHQHFLRGAPTIQQVHHISPVG